MALTLSAVRAVLPRASPVRRLVRSAASPKSRLALRNRAALAPTRPSKPAASSLEAVDQRLHRVRPRTARRGVGRALLLQRPALHHRVAQAAQRDGQEAEIIPPPGAGDAAVKVAFEQSRKSGGKGREWLDHADRQQQPADHGDHGCERDTSKDLQIGPVIRFGAPAGSIGGACRGRRLNLVEGGVDVSEGEGGVIVPGADGLLAISRSGQRGGACPDGIVGGKLLVESGQASLLRRVERERAVAPPASLIRPGLLGDGLRVAGKDRGVG